MPAARPPQGGGGGGEWSEDEFERDMESELMCVLQTVTSPDALTAAVSPQGMMWVKGVFYDTSLESVAVAFFPKITHV